MPSLADHHSNDLVKLLLLGDAKSGKTGSLVSLVEAGYKLRILDLDNLLDFFAKMVKERCPTKLANVEYRTLRDKYKMGAAGPVIDGVPKAFIETIKMLDNWKYVEDGKEVDLGKPATWGPDCVLVLDSLSRLCDSAFDWRETLTPRGKSGEADTRMTFYDAQSAIENVLAGLTSPLFETNVIVICHGVYMELPDKTTKIFPQGVGQKLSPKIPQYFPNYVRFKNIGGKRTIQLNSDAMIDLANTNPRKFDQPLDTDTGLAKLFEGLRGSKPQPELKVIPRTAMRK